MSSLGSVTTILASAVADDGTVAVAYPTGTTRATLSLAAGAEKAVIARGRLGSWSLADPGINVSYGASTITITNRTGESWPAGTEVVVSFGDEPRVGSYNATIGDDEQQAKRGSGTQELTVSGAVAPGVNFVELNHASGAIAATIASSLAHRGGIFTVKDTSATGTAAHTVTLAHGTWNGTNNVITLNLLNECISVVFDSAGNGTIIENVGGVGLS